MVGSSVIDSHTGPCLCLDAVLPSANNTTTILNKKQHIPKKSTGSLELTSSFTDCWQGWRVSTMPRKHNGKHKKLVVVNELGGQYEDTFEDVQTALVNYFTYKAVRTVMHQLYEMNPSHYGWFYEFVRTNKPGGDGKRFIRTLQKERHDLAERVMITRLHLYGKWVKKCNHAEIYNSISDDNLALMRERLMETVIWPSDDSSSEIIS
ncbi:hypothetical protein ACFE04_028542 [Oxalis oulophora]